LIFFRYVLAGEAKHIPFGFDAPPTYDTLLDLDELYIQFETAPKLVASWRSSPMTLLWWVGFHQLGCYRGFFN
jgi:hypothetical protein